MVGNSFNMGKTGRLGVSAEVFRLCGFYHIRLVNHTNSNGSFCCQNGADCEEKNGLGSYTFWSMRPMSDLKKKILAVCAIAASGVMVHSLLTTNSSSQTSEVSGISAIESERVVTSEAQANQQPWSNDQAAEEIINFNSQAVAFRKLKQITEISKSSKSSDSVVGSSQSVSETTSLSDTETVTLRSPESETDLYSPTVSSNTERSEHTSQQKQPIHQAYVDDNLSNASENQLSSLESNPKSATDEGLPPESATQQTATQQTGSNQTTISSLGADKAKELMDPQSKTNLNDATNVADSSPKLEAGNWEKEQVESVRQSLPNQTQPIKIYDPLGTNSQQDGTPQESAQTNSGGTSKTNNIQAPARVDSVSDARTKQRDSDKIARAKRAITEGLVLKKLPRKRRSKPSSTQLPTQEAAKNRPAHSSSNKPTGAKSPQQKTQAKLPGGGSFTPRTIPEFPKTPPGTVDFHGGNFHLDPATLRTVPADRNQTESTIPSGNKDILEKLWKEHQRKRAVPSKKNDPKIPRKIDFLNQKIRVKTPSPNAQVSYLQKLNDSEQTEKPAPKKGNPYLAERNENFEPWWINRVSGPIREAKISKEITLESVVSSTILYSPFVAGISRDPIIAETFIREADSAFDTELFVDSKWNDSTEPVGNILITGTAEFLKDNVWEHQSGIRKRFRNGGDLSLTQDLGFQNSNSNFFDPQDQGTARLSLNFTQPLLNGRGKLVNRSQILIAQLNRDVAYDRFSQFLQEHLLETISSYWDVYYRRTVYLQSKKNYDRAVEILKILEGRRDYDTVANQLARAKAAVFSRRVEVRRAINFLVNAETKLRELVRDPEYGALGDGGAVELVPAQLPLVVKPEMELSQLVNEALTSRPEVDQAFKNIRSSSVEMKIAENDILPVLSLVVGGYLAGLEGDTGIEKAWVEQFNKTPPSYHAGIVFEYPLGNRAAKSRLKRSKNQLKQLTDQMASVMGKVVADVEIANRDLVTQYDTFKNTMESVESAISDAEYIRKRWENFAFVENVGVNTPNTLLEQLLDAQQRLVDAENSFAAALRDFMIAQSNLQIATGTLLRQKNISTFRSGNLEDTELTISRDSADSNRQPRPMPAPKSQPNRQPSIVPQEDSSASHSEIDRYQLPKVGRYQIDGNKNIKTSQPMPAVDPSLRDNSFIADSEIEKPLELPKKLRMTPESKNGERTATKRIRQIKAIR